MTKKTLAIACTATAVVVAVVLALLLSLLAGPARKTPAEQSKPEKEEPTEQYASDAVEEEAFTVPGTPVHASQELSDSGQELAQELGDAVPVVNATFGGMPFCDFMSRMMQVGVVFVVHDRSADEFSRIARASPVAFERTNAETLVAFNSRYCRIGSTAEGIRDVVEPWLRSRAGSAGSPDILMFMPRRAEWAVLGALRSADPPPDTVSTYCGEYRSDSRGGVELVIRSATTRKGEQVEMNTAVAF